LHYLSHPCVKPDCSSYCLLLHGFTNDAHIWDQLAAELRRSHHVIALDQRGHGDSDWDPERKYSHWQLAEDLRDFLRTLDGATVHIVGHSLGARVAILALEELAGVAASLTIIDAGPEVNPEAGDRLVHDVMQLPSHYADVRAYRDSLARIYVMANTEALEHVMQFGLRISQGKLITKTDPAFTPGIWHKTPELRNLHKERGALSDQLWKALRALDLPVHLLRGQASSILEPVLASKMVQELGGRAVLSVVPRAGHAVMLDNPPASITSISTFIESVNGTGNFLRTAV
jgi:pimeloyl-ACP methyl ester carboxylesterase